MANKDLVGGMGRALVCAVFLAGGVDRMRERGWTRNLALFGGLLSLALLVTQEEKEHAQLESDHRHGLNHPGPRPGYLDEAQQTGWST